MKKSLLIALFLFSFGCTSIVDSTLKPSGDNKTPVINNKGMDDIKGDNKDDNEGGNKNDMDGGSLAPAPVVSANPLPSASASGSTTTPVIDTSAKVQFATIKTIMDNRCVTCHNPSKAKAGVSLDTIENIKLNLAGIKSSTVNRTSMPPNNSTGMTTEERTTLGTWISQGAN